MNFGLRFFLGRVLRFGLVGVLGTLLYAGVAFGLERAGLPVFSAHVLASAISLAASYVGQKIFTFNVRGQHRKMGFRFAVATAGLVAVQSTIVFVLSRSDVPPQLVLLAGTLFYPPASFLIHTFWTFREPPGAAG